ncbi:MAG: hypothetical protein LQ346_002716 [Caloplaca aetnensis]|nr:MAG: hypothetical protein LQ346_002716 [Caloplaca aetnensis]
MSLVPSSTLSCLFFLLFQNAVALSLKSTGGTLMLGDIPYYIPASPYTTISPQGFGRLNSVTGLSPVTVVSVIAGNDSAGGLGSILKDYAADDVWNTGFLEGRLQRSLTEALRILVGPTDKKSRTFGTIHWQWLQAELLLGVYTVIRIESVKYHHFHKEQRLFDGTERDFAGAFTQPLIPSSGDTYAALPATLPGIQSPGIGVPSRLYYTRSASKPLAGVRVGIKDIYDIAGVKTSDGNRAVYGFYPPATVNSVPVQRLVDAGAILVGKMKTSQFANGEMATADWVDYHSPFNPRGDGYQDPSSSSSGPGAGAASYPWLDLTLGSDTGGSIRGPSQVQGLFGNRPTHNLVSLTGTMPLAPELDTAGFLCRDPIIWKAAGIALYADLPFYSDYPTTIQTINFPTSITTEASNITLSFLSKLQTFLNAKSTTALNLTTSWAASRPTSAPASLASFLNITYPVIISKQQTRLVRDPFFAAYAAVHDGRKPFVDPAPLVRWAYGDSQPESALAEALKNKTIFMDWFNSKILVNNSRTCSESLLLYPGSVNPNYRNQYIKPPTVPFGFSTGRISVFSEVPDVVVPIGQAAYRSNITEHMEMLPVTMDFLAAKGCDGMLFNLIEDLTAAGIVSPTQAGQTIAGGEILLKRGMVGL